MCEFCTEHGEGKKWYEVMRNYSHELADQIGTYDYIDFFVTHFRERVCSAVPTIDALKVSNPVAYRFIRLMYSRRLKHRHWGQVVPIEDIEQIVDRMDSIVRFPCACRKLTTGRDVRYCFGIGADYMGILGKYPDYSHSLELLEKQEAKDLLRSFDKQGMMHSIWTMKTPFIGAICNCDMDCVAYRIQVKTNSAQGFFRAEYVSEVDWDLCVGCKVCLSHCQFGAIGYSLTTKKAAIDMTKCYGCGVCRAVCSKGAITLRPRAEIPALSW